MTPIALDSAIHDVPDSELQYDEKFSHYIDSSHRANYQKYASLKNVRKIQASIGICGRFRAPSHISGLKLDYFDHPSPGTVGQWMSGLDNSLELSRDEETQSLTIWLTPTGFSTTSPGLEIGQVAAVRIQTSRCRTVTFRSPDFDSPPARKLHHQYTSGSDERLSAISWILNPSADRVRALASSKKQKPRLLILVPEQVPPFDLVQKLYFETQVSNGRVVKMTTAEAYFRDGIIIGLGFIYTSGTNLTLGDLDTSTRESVHFEPEEQVVNLSIPAMAGGLTEIEFEVERDGHSQYKKLALSLPASSTNAVEDDWRDVWCKDERSASQYKQTSKCRDIYQAPSNSRLVGIYVGCQHFSDFGGLYEPLS